MDGKVFSLLTGEELEAAVGEEMWGRGEVLRHGGGISECMFQYEENRIFVRLRTGTSWFAYVKAVDRVGVVAGLGEEAYWYPVSKCLPVRVRGSSLEIQLSLPPKGLKTNQKAAALKRAKKAVARLKR
ncbi:hypothetical protein CSW37_02355 [Thermus scotoductus]|uniref:Uncharacterized protein n=1 Tax=Thermus scotoductus TaxID=37636 RepID=A0A430SH70_THESC|nr:hypothetical protein [Thermus scotoductus]RTH07795.1 hypothetical protein CSW47_01030 [Thermus scotoductus]RTH39325.1 hypothetical protein CSW37_02355 [Thermus scotoductus]